MNAYWAQWNNTEIMSMHGIEPNNHNDDDEDHDDEEEGDEEDEDCCPRCRGSGCNYCLMLSW